MGDEAVFWPTRPHAADGTAEDVLTERMQCVCRYFANGEKTSHQGRQYPWNLWNPSRAHAPDGGKAPSTAGYHSLSPRIGAACPPLIG